MHTTKKILSSFLIVLLGIPFIAQTSQEPIEPDESLKYRVAVNVMVVPVFAVDRKGNPVYDLKQEELQLYVNDEPTDVLLFKRYEFGHEQKIKETVESGKSVEAVEQSQDRVIFIILDTMFNSLTGFRRTKEIATNLIKERLPGDHFVVLENNPVGGLKYIGGSDKDVEQLIKKIKKLNPPPDKWSSDLHASRVLRNNISYDPMTDPRLESGKWKSVRDLHVSSESQRYQHQVRYFIRVLSQFRYALKTIDKPKIVFLISEGIALGAFRAALGAADTAAAGGGAGSSAADALGTPGKGFYSILNQDEKTVFDQNKIYSSFMLKYLVDVVRSINKGGSVLYTINPRRTDDINDDEASGEMSLRYMAGESGGKYFAGSKPKKIIERVKKTTAAYYELFYSIIPDMGSDMNVRLECKRKGVRIHSLSHTEKNRPYYRMEPVQKKLFALNVVTGGSWSRIAGRVMKVKYKKSKPAKGESEKVMTLQVPLPNVMRNHKVDMFLFHMDPKTQKTDINLMSSNVTDVVNIKFKPKKDKNQFFVIIEPTTPYCIYNKI
jgi:hypothetical protein